MTIRRLCEGDEDAAVRVVEDLKFRRADAEKIRFLR